MPTVEEQINAIEEEIRKTPYNKASQHHIGKLKAKLARLREEQGKKSKAKGSGFGVKKTGHATAALIGFPSVGKSTLLNKLTNASSRVENFDFTTLDVIPGLMNYEGAKIQILDIPGLISGASRGKGRGREILSVARISDLLLILIDAKKLEQRKIIERELHVSGIKINKKPPNVKLKKTLRGGVTFSSSIKNPGISIEEIRGVLNENGIFNADVTIREKINLEDFIDVIMKNRVYIPAIFIVNKLDMLTEEEIKELEQRDLILISAKNEVNLEKLREEIFKRLSFIRVYMKPQGKSADMEKPLILKEGSTIENLCNELHRAFKEKFRYARVSGPSAKFEYAKVGLNHELKDRDIVTIIRSL